MEYPLNEPLRRGQRALRQGKTASIRAVFQANDRFPHAGRGGYPLEGKIDHEALPVLVAKLEHAAFFGLGASVQGGFPTGFEEELHLLGNRLVLAKPRGAKANRRVQPGPKDKHPQPGNPASAPGLRGVLLGADHRGGKYQHPRPVVQGVDSKPEIDVEVDSAHSSAVLQSAAAEQLDR